MPLLERGYRSAAKADLERSLRELEDKDKAAQLLHPDEQFTSVGSNIDFAERIGLITEAAAQQLRDRCKQAQLDFARLQRTETLDVVNDFENHRERAARYQRMDEVQAQIAKEKAEAAAQQGKDDLRSSAPSRSSENLERAK